MLLAAAFSPLAVCLDSAQAQKKQSAVVIGYLGVSSKEANARLFSAFKEGLAALGWKEGVNYRIEGRWADAQVERLDALAQELVRSNPRIIVASPSNAVAAAAKAAPHLPVVQANGGTGLIMEGLVKSLARPGGMVTGVSNVITEASGKQLELLLAAVPSVRRVGFLIENERGIEPAQRAVERLRVEGHFAQAPTLNHIEPALAKLAKDGVQALVILTGSFFGHERARIVKIALQRRWPTVANLREFTENGALMSYGADRSALYTRAAYYVDKILKGAKPGDLPIEEPTRFDLVINRKTADLLGIRIPQELLLRADKVIE